MDLWSSLPQIEGVFYTRNTSDTKSSFIYRNHILQGPYLRYINHPLRPKDVGRFRMVLVQGTRKGRLRGIRLSPESEINVISSSQQSAFPTSYIIEVTGTDLWGKEERWQLAMQSKDALETWTNAIEKAKSFLADIDIKELDKLREIAKTIKEKIVLRKRLSRFRIHGRCFIGQDAVKLIMGTLNCTLSQALIVGNKMLNCGFFHHVTDEHLFLCKRLCYRFSVEIDPLVASLEKHVLNEEEENELDEEVLNIFMQEHNNDMKEVFKAFTKLQLENKNIQYSLHRTGASKEYLQNVLNLIILQYRGLQYYLRYNSWFLILSQLLGFLYLMSKYFHFFDENSSEKFLIYMFVLFFLFSLYSLLKGKLNLGQLSGFYRFFRLETLTHTQSEQLKLIQNQTSAELRQYFLENYSDSEQGNDCNGHDVFFDDDDGSISSAIQSLAVSGLDAFISDEVDEHVASPAGSTREPKKPRNFFGRLSSTHIPIVSPAKSAVARFGHSVVKRTKGRKKEGGGTNEERGNKGNYSSNEDYDESEDDEEELVEGSDHEGFHPLRKGLRRLSNVRKNWSKKTNSPNVPQSLHDENLLDDDVSALEFEDRVKQLMLLQQLGHPDNWPNQPVAIRRSPEMLAATNSTQQSSQKQKLLQPLKLHIPGPAELSLVPIESDLFSGRAYIIMANLPDSPHDQFRWKQRKFQYVIQGKFKKDLKFSEIYTGQIFDSPLSQMPSRWVLKAALGLIARLQPAMQIHLTGDRPFIVSPLMSTCQHIVISKEGDEPGIAGVPITENMSLLNPVFTRMSSRRRKAFFSKRCNLEKFRVNPELVYTFDFYQHMFNFGTFQFDFGVLKYDLLRILGVKPIQIMAVAWDPTLNSLQASRDSEDQKHEKCENPDDPTILTQPSPHGLLDFDIMTEEPPSSMQYIYNFEVWHRRCFNEEILQQILLTSSVTKSASINKSTKVKTQESIAYSGVRKRKGSPRANSGGATSSASESAQSSG